MSRHPESDRDSPGTDPPLGPLAADLAATSLTMARRFAAGATMWCWAPGHGEHARHVAVEFVHPVIVGKRALPAVAVGAEPGEAGVELRSLVRVGDVIVVVGAGADDPEVADVLRRAPSWGATTVWIGAGDRVGAGAADHVLCLGGDAALAAHDGRLVLAYHLLWELTHVCFEHPGLLAAPAGGDAPDERMCVTCSDEGRVGEVVRAGGPTATVRTARGEEEVDTSVVGEVGPGDLVLVHAGTALAVVGPPP